MPTAAEYAAASGGIVKTTSPGRTLKFPGLVASSRDTGEGYHVSAKRYATGDIRAVAVKIGREQSLHRGGGAKRRATSKDEMTAEVAAKSKARAKRMVKERGLMMQADRILTLTFKDNITDLQEAWRYFTRFSKRMRYVYGDRWKYICVPEFQERGAVHFHCAVNGYFEVGTVRRIWRGQCPGGQGNIDITSPRNRKSGNKTKSPKKVVAYISKYITKGDAAAFNGKRYSTSSNIEPPEVQTGWLPACWNTYLVAQVLDEIITANGHRPVLVRWESDDGVKVFMHET